MKGLSVTHIQGNTQLPKLRVHRYKTTCSQKPKQRVCSLVVQRVPAAGTLMNRNSWSYYSTGTCSAEFRVGVEETATGERESYNCCSDDDDDDNSTGPALMRYSNSSNRTLFSTTNTTTTTAPTSFYHVTPSG